MRKTLTQRFPFLLPFRVRQRKLFFYAGLALDGRRYTKSVADTPAPYTVFQTHSGLYNTETGFDMCYQENKVFNLKLAAGKLNGLLIKPGETFSFWKALRRTSRDIPYKDGLTFVNGNLTTTSGGGLCQMSNLLFWLFLHSPLTVAERHTHKLKDFPKPQSDTPEGVDATVSEGWLDLKVKNDTDNVFQLFIRFDDENILGSLMAEKAVGWDYEIEGRGLSYFRRGETLYEKIAIYRRQISKDTGALAGEKLLYENQCRIGPRYADTLPFDLKRSVLQYG